MRSVVKDTKEILKEMFDIDIDQLSEKAKMGLEDVENNHDCSWTLDLYEKNKNNLKNISIFYRGTRITYQKLFDNALKYASIFESMGVKEGSEVPMCMAQCPEFLYSIMGLNLLGAKMNCFGAFDKDYLTEIMNGCNSDFMICTDDQYSSIKESIDNSKVEKVVLFSLTDSLAMGIDPYYEIDKDFYEFKNKVPKIKEQDSKVIDKDEFLNISKNVKSKEITDYNVGDLNTEFLVTYSSGSTNANRPKAIVHTNRSLITIGRFQDPDMSGLPPMKDLIGEAMIPTHSNTGIISSMSDVLYKGCTVAQEPIYNKDFFLYSLAINKPNYISVPRNMIVDGAKKIYGDKRFANFTMPYMMMLTSVGEPTSLGEEKFINKMLKKAKCGVSKLPKPLAPVPLSIGGGDCERGGMFFTPYRALQDLHPKYKFLKKRCGLKKYAMVQLAVVDEQNNILPNGSVGRLIAKTPTTMKKYKNNPEATEKFFITASDGSKWSDCETYAIIEKYGTTEVLERIGKELQLKDGSKLPLFCIGKEVERDTKHILSYEVVNVDNEAVIHIELQPGVKNNIPKILMGIENRVYKKYGYEVAQKLTYRIRRFEEGFPRTACEKRSYSLLLKEGITEQCVKPIYKNNRIELVPQMLDNTPAKTKHLSM